MWKAPRGLSELQEQANSRQGEDISIGEPVRKRRLLNPQVPINW